MVKKMNNNNHINIKFSISTNGLFFLNKYVHQILKQDCFG